MPTADVTVTTTATRKPCPLCKGKGTAVQVDAIIPGQPPVNPRMVPCMVCEGEGYFDPGDDEDVEPAPALERARAELADANTATIAQVHRDLMAFRDAEVHRLRLVAHDAIRGRTAGASALDAVRAALTGYGAEASAPETRVADLRREVERLRSELARERGLRTILSRILDAPLPRVRDQLWGRVRARVLS